ncbi:MAG: glycosyl hydrolase family 18 protein [Deltaproteobacteria bacterium]
MTKKFFLALYLVLVLFLLPFFNFPSIAAKPLRDRIAPTTPSNLTASFITDNSVDLSWNPSTDNVNVSSYYVYKSSSFFASSVTTSYKVTGLSSGTSYTFYIKARDGAGNLSSSSSSLTITTTKPIQPPPSQPSKKLIGYYAGWAGYNGFTPDKIDAGKLTHINYAFANISSDLKIAIGDPGIDPSNFEKLKTLKLQYPNIKTLISVGGWSWSEKFSDAALSDSSRTIFADSCVQFIKANGFDGVDIDWEYPVGGGLPTNVYRSEDKQNFTLLLAKIREKLDAQGAADGKKYLLTIAGGASQYYINNTELRTLEQYLDYANIMTYDIHGTWDTYTDFNSPLYNNTDTSPQYKLSIDSVVNAWVNAGVPIDKLVIGIPFYGYKYNSVTNINNGLYQKFSGGSSISYASITANYLNSPGYIRYYHSQSQVPWLFNGSTFISYDDQQSVGIKAGYVKTKGLGGAMLWELSQDPNKVLLNAVYNGLQ